MKKQLFISAAIAFLAITCGSMANAQPDGYYKQYHINQNFDGLEALPSGWSTNTSNSSTSGALFGHAGGHSITNDLLITSGSGSGTRGIDIIFPAPQSNESIDPSETWTVELDWTINSAALGHKNALGIVFSGNNITRTSDPATCFNPGIFGLYTFGDGYLHYWNLDLEGPENDITADPNDHFGPALIPGWYGFGRAHNSLDNAKAANLSTQTNVTYAAGKTYHITAVLNFTSQEVTSLTITDKDDSENTQTFGTQPFLAPSLVGSGLDMADEDQKAANLAIISVVNTRNTHSELGNGDSAGFETYLDNLEIYYLKESLGLADVTINYKDREGNQAKASRIIADQEISTVYRLLVSDKEGFIEGTNYFACDAEATHAANTDKGSGDGESVTVATGASLDVIFKKSTLTPGTYVWTGANGFNWSELDDNFSVSGGASISYQNGNAVAFSGADVINKEILVPANLNLGEGDMTVSAEGYSFSGNGRLEGTGTLILDVPAILNMENRLEGGALVNTTDPIPVKHAAAAAKFNLIDNATLKLEAEANFNKAIEGSGGTINFDRISDYACNSAITGAEVINIQLTNPGRLRNDTWSTNWAAGFPEGVQINVSNNVETGRKAGFGVANATLQNAKVHLGDSVRLVRNYNEANGGTDVLYVGELSGTAAARVEGGFIDARQQTYQIGGLNTDAVFAGTIDQYTRTDSTFSTSILHLVKDGSGKWTLTGDLLFTGDLTVKKGTLALSGFVMDSVSQIQVDSAAVLELNGALIQSGLINVAKNGILSGSTDAYNITLAGSTLKLQVNSFTEGDHDKIITQGDFSIIASLDNEPNVLDITVNAATRGEKVKLIEVLANPTGTFERVLVNGVDITANTTDTPGAEFVWDSDTYELLSLIDREGAAIDEITGGKTVKNIQYCDLTGRTVTREAKGWVIKKITYTDGTRTVQKTFILK